MEFSIRYICFFVFLFQAPTIVFSETVSQSSLPTSEEEIVAEGNTRVAAQPVHSLEYKPIRPSYLSSGSNVAQIVPPGQPWPASAAGYQNFSQLTSSSSGGAVLMASPTSNNSNQVIKLDFSKAGVDATAEFEQALAPQLANANVPSSQQRTISYSLEITPPANAGQEFITTLQSAVKAAVAKLAPNAGSQMQLRLTKTSTGTIVGVKLSLNVIIPATTQTTQTTTTSSVPEIDLTKSTASLPQNLVTIISYQLSKQGYVSESNEVQKFNFAFSILPPAGATKDYVKLYVLAPLQAALRQVAPDASISSVSVNTQESGGKILKQTVNFSVQTNPSAQPTTNESVINIPTIDWSQSSSNLGSILKNAIGKVAAQYPSQEKELVIPFQIKNSKATTKEQIQELYIDPLQKILSQANPNGAVTKIAAKTTSDGQLLLTFYYTLSPSTKNDETGSSDLQNRDAEIGVVSTESTVSPKNENLIPTNAVTAPLVDLTKSGASLNDIQTSLDSVLSPKANPDASKSKTLAIPIQVKLPAGATAEQYQQNVVQPIEQLLEKLEPTGKVLTSTSKDLSNGDVGTIVYFEVPSVENTNTYKNLEKKEPVVVTEDINLDEPGASVSKEVSKALVSSLVINPKEKDKSEIVNMNVYTPPNSTPTQVQNVVDDITSELKQQEPTGKVISTKVNQNSSKTEPDAVVSYFVPSIKDSKTAQDAKNAISVPTIDINRQGVNLVDEIQDVVKSNADKINTNGAQLLNFNFKMNPYNEKGSIETILKALKTADPDGSVATYKIKTGDDGLEYLDVIYLITRKKKAVKEAVVDIDAKKPLSNLLQNVVDVVTSAEDNLKGVAQKGQVVDIPLNFRLTNTEGLSDRQISKVIDQFYPSLKSYLGQVLPDSQILSSKVYCPSDSDDVILKTTVRATYNPDDVIVIEEVHKKTKVTTTERTGIFGFKIFG